MLLFLATKGDASLVALLEKDVNSTDRIVANLAAATIAKLKGHDVPLVR
ncbi:MAG: hypothetical protein ACRC37_04715 [Lentisphaeria bacterium]